MARGGRPMAPSVWLAAPREQADPLDTYTPLVSKKCSMVSLLTQFVLRFSTSFTASAGLFRVISGSLSRPARSRAFSAATWGVRRAAFSCIRLAAVASPTA